MRVKGCGFRFRGLGVCVLGGGWGFRSWIESLGFRVLGFGIHTGHFCLQLVGVGFCVYELLILGAEHPSPKKVNLFKNARIKKTAKR